VKYLCLYTCYDSGLCRKFDEGLVYDLDPASLAGLKKSGQIKRFQRAGEEPEPERPAAPEKPAETDEEKGTGAPEKQKAKTPKG
jgi:hypothetical protein